MLASTSDDHEQDTSEDRQGTHLGGTGHLFRGAVLKGLAELLGESSAQVIVSDLGDAIDGNPSRLDRRLRALFGERGAISLERRILLILYADCGIPFERIERSPHADFEREVLRVLGKV
jgi:hypothetical protein